MEHTLTCFLKDVTYLRWVILFSVKEIIRRNADIWIYQLNQQFNLTGSHAGWLLHPPPKHFIPSASCNFSGVIFKLRSSSADQDAFPPRTKNIWGRTVWIWPWRTAGDRSWPHCFRPAGLSHRSAFLHLYISESVSVVASFKPMQSECWVCGLWL